MKPAIAKIVMLGGSLGALVCLLVAVVLQETPAMLYVFGGLGIAMMVVSYVVQMLFWKCPVCGNKLPSKGFWNLRTCPRCKETL